MPERDPVAHRDGGRRVALAAGLWRIKLRPVAPICCVHNCLGAMAKSHQFRGESLRAAVIASTWRQPSVIDFPAPSPDRFHHTEARDNRALLQQLRKLKCDIGNSPGVLKSGASGYPFGFAPGTMTFEVLKHRDHQFRDDVLGQELRKIGELRVVKHGALVPAQSRPVQRPAWAGHSRCTTGEAGANGRHPAR